MFIIPLMAAVYGLILGSFFNVLICRIPEKKSIFRPASHCPKCKTPIKPLHNIPVFSYLFLGGKCHSCKQPIPITYPLIETLTGGAALAIWYFYPPSLQPLSWQSIVVYATRVSFLLLIIPISMIDLRHYIIPDLFTLPFLVIAAGIAFLPGSPTPLTALYGILAGGGLLLAIGAIGSLLLKKDAMGGGDIKLMAAAGALWGAQTALLSILFGALLGSVYGIVLMAIRKLNSDHQIPFGPFLGAGVWIAVLFGDKLMNSWLSVFDRLAGG
ncbi:MAG: prepilin peptidase [Chitinispirillaceae bacterium]|nr:prepilin peptidase [Chitinispirillaceae bacterium]